MKTNLRALVIEDDQTWQQLLSELLMDCGLEVDVADNFEQATNSLRSQPHRLAVVDLSLSPNDHNNQDGLRALEAARKLDPNCRTILLTGFATVELAVAALTDHGAFTFLRKENFHRNQFREVVNRILVSPSLPTENKTAPASREYSPPRPIQAGNIKSDKALVVDDDAGWRTILEELLMETGFQVRTSASFGEAIGCLRKDRFVLAVIDLSLKDVQYRMGQPPGTVEELEGHQLLAATKGKSIHTIVVSGVGEPQLIQQVYADYSITAFIEKQTFDRNAFRRIVDELIIITRNQSKLGSLTEREREVLELVAQGLTNKEIAEKLVITANTVKRHIKAIFEKLGVHTRSAATAKVTGGR